MTKLDAFLSEKKKNPQSESQFLKAFAGVSSEKNPSTVITNAKLLRKSTVKIIPEYLYSQGMHQRATRSFALWSRPMHPFKSTKNINLFSREQSKGLDIRDLRRAIRWRKKKKEKPTKKSPTEVLDCTIAICNPRQCVFEEFFYPFKTSQILLIHWQTHHMNIQWRRSESKV